MRNKLTKFLTSECPPKGMRQFTKTWKYVACMLLAFTLAIGQMWGANGDVLFTQDFSGVTPLAYRYTSGTVTETYSYSESGTTLSGLVGTGANLFTSLESSIKKGDIAINSATGGNNVDATGIFRVYSNGDNATQYSLVRSANLATTAPTALKVTFDIKFKNLSSGSNPGVSFAIGSGFTDNSLSLENKSNVHSGFSIVQGSTPYLVVYSTTTKFTGNPSITSDKWMSVVWVINNTGDKLKYDNPTGSGQTELNNDCFDLWIKQTSAEATTYTCIVSNQAANTPAKDLQNIFIGNAEKKKHELGLDNIVVTDLSPAPATNYTVTIDPNGGSYASTPDGWTESAGVYTKSIASGTSFSAPAGLTKGTDDLTWKDGSDNDVTFPVSITGNITFVAQWAPHAVSDDATLKSLTVNGDAVAGFDPATIVYNVELPFGTVAVPTVAGAANDANAKSVVVTPAASLPGSTTVVVTAEDNSTKTYTINFTVSASKDILLVFKTGSTACNSTASTASQILSNNAAVLTYINPITFTNVEGDGDNGAEGSSLNVGKKAGNMFTLTPKAGYAIKALSFYAKVQDATCEYSLDGGAWITLTSTNTGGDDCYSDIFSAAEVHEFRLRSTGTSGVWIRNMKLSITTACTPIVVSWTSEPAAEYELGKAATAIAAAANSGAAITYASDATGVIEVATDGALTLKALGTANLSASAPAGDGSLYCDASGDQISKSVKTYYLVTFDPQNGEATSSTKYYAGDAAIALPSAPSWPGHTFQGWFDAASAGTQVTSAVTPEASRTIYAQWTLDCAGATINTQPVGANYLIGRTATALNCEATAGNGGALTYTWYSCDDALGTNPVALAGAPTPSTAAAATFYYYCTVIEEGCATIATSDIVTVNVAPKDGVSIIKVATTGGSNKTVTGLYAGEGDVNLSDSKKMDGGKYIGFTLDGTTLQAGDRINVHTTTASTSGGSHIIFYDNMTDKNELYDTEEIGGVGNNIFTINAAMVGNATAYVYRSDADAVHKWNGFIDYIEVTRAINPILTAITINGRDGEIDALDDHHFTVTIPSDANLASLTIVPTIVSNTAEADVVKTVESNGGAWVLTADGDNTYRIKDKDGDYTDYTITLIRDVLKYTVTFDTDGGNSIDAVEVVADGYLTAGQVPADPTKEDYIFQYWSLGGSEVADLTAVQIDEPKTFVAVWAADGAIKLLDGATVNHTNFITGVTADETVEFMGNTVNYAKFAGTCGNVNNVKDLTKSIIYNATTNKTKIQISAHNNSTSGRNIYVIGLAEGASEAVELANISLGNKEDKVSDWIEFDNAANRTIYIMVPSSAGDVYFTQVKVIESGETPMKQAGETGYSLNFNKGRFFGIKDNIIAFEGLNVGIASSDCQPLNTSIVKLNNTSMSFTVASAMTLSVTTNNNKTYYVTEGAAGTDNETAKTGVSEFNLTAGTWYITAGASNVEITNIAFSAPKCAEPVIDAQPASKLDFAAGDMTASVTAHATDGGTLKYQWYKAADDSEVAGQTTETLTTTEEGAYYVIVTNTLADHSDNFVKSDEATLKYRKADDATLSALTVSEGTLDPIFDPAVLEYNVTLPEGTVDVPTLTATAAMAAYGATADVTNAAAFVNYEATSTVLVTAEDHSTQQTYTVHFYVDHTILALADVTGDMTWDFSKDGLADQATVGTEVIMANVAGVVNDANFKSDNIKVTANKQAGTKLQASMIMFHTTVDGLIKVVFSNTGDKSSERYLVVNGKKTDSGTKTKTNITYYGFVPAGDVVLTVIEGDGNMLNFASVQFTAKAAADLARDAAHGDDWMAPGELGTVCIPNGAVATGGDLYTLEGKNSDGKIVFATVPNNKMTPGVPYLFQATSNSMKFYYTEEAAVTDPDNSGAMKGTFVDLDLTDLTNVYYFAGHALWSCSDLTSLEVKANRAWVDMSKVGSGANPAPGRRYIIMDVHGQNAATGIGNVQGDEVQSTKVLINGQLFILRGEKMYDATGRLVK